MADISRLRNSFRYLRCVSIGDVNRQWVEARKAAGLPESPVLYCGRHDYRTYVLVKTGNLKLVMDSMGHADVKTAMKYQNPELEIVRQALNAVYGFHHHVSHHAVNQK